MKIDVTARIADCIRLTEEWSAAAGYKQPVPPVEAASKKANDLRRILAVSDFGCQQRNVHAILEAIIGEPIPFVENKPSADYVQRVPFAVGSCLVPVGHHEQRPGVVNRLSARGYAGLRKSNGELHNNHFQQHDLRPATPAEIEAYYSEFFGVTLNPADAVEPDAASDADELGVPL